MAVELPLEGLVGRTTELAEVVEQLEIARFVTLTGLGGTGKTRLAAAVAQAWRELGRVAVVVDLAPIADVGLIAAAIADQLEVDEDSSRPMADVVIQRLAGWSGLIVLDNLEQFVAGAPAEVTSAARSLLRRIGHASASVAILATSRVALGIPGELELPLLPLPVRTSGGLADPSAAASELFVREARLNGGLRPGTTLDPELIARICEAVGGLPLGIQLAAARTRVIGLSELADRLGRHAALEAGKSLEAILAWTTSLLASADRQHLLHLSYFSADFSLAEAAIALDLDDALEPVEHLVRVGLITRHDDRFSLPVPVRQWAARRWNPATNDAQRRLAGYVAKVGLAAAPDLRGPAVVATVRRLRLLEPLVRQLLDWSTVADPDLAAEILAAFRGYWFHAERIGEVRERCEDLHGRSLSSGSLAKVLLILAETEIEVGGPAAALPISLSALESARLGADHRTEGLVRHQLGRLYGELGQYDDARSHHGAALEIARRQGDVRAEIVILANHAANENSAGRAESALRLYDEAAALAREANDQWDLAIITGNAAVAIGVDKPEALSRFTLAARMLEEIGPSRYVAWARLGRIEALLAQSQADDAAADLSDVIELVAHAGTWMERSFLADCAGVYMLSIGRSRLGVDLFGRAQRIRDLAGVAPNLDDVWLANRIGAARKRVGQRQFDEWFAIGLAADPETLLGDVAELLRLAPLHVGPTAGQYGRLSAREDQVLGLVGRGMTDPEIATDLGISPKTVSVHVSNIKTKLGLESRIDVALAGQAAHAPAARS